MSMDEEGAASSGESTDDIRADMAEEAERQDVVLRLLGGVAIKVRAEGGLHPAFERDYVDLDWITKKGKSSQVQTRVKTLQERIEEEPKSFGWKMRSKIGDRKRWYELSEEVEGGP